MVVSSAFCVYTIDRYAHRRHEDECVGYDTEPVLFLQGLVEWKNIEIKKVICLLQGEEAR